MGYCIDILIFEIEGGHIIIPNLIFFSKFHLIPLIFQVFLNFSSKKLLNESFIIIINVNSLNYHFNN